MAKPRKPYSQNAHKQQVIARHLHQVWIAGGHCCHEHEIGMLPSIPMTMEILNTKQQWTALLLAFAISPDGTPYLKSEIWAFPQHQTKEQLQHEVMPLLNALADSIPANQLISPGYFLVPTLHVDLIEAKEQIIERFRQWGAWDTQLCNLAWFIRQLKWERLCKAK